MIIKKVESDSMSSCLKRAKDLFGTNAKIHSTNRLSNGRYQLVASGPEIVRSIKNKSLSLDDDNYIEDFVQKDDHLEAFKIDFNRFSEKISSRLDKMDRSIEGVSWGVESKLNPNTGVILGMLLENGVAHADAKNLCKNLPRDREFALNRAKHELINGADFGFEFDKGIHGFFGPSGSGKTTALLKIAILLKNKGISCCIIAGDSNTPSGPVEIKHLGDYIGIEVFNKTSDVPKKTFEAILVDNPTDKMFESKLLIKHLISCCSINNSCYDKYNEYKNKFSSIIITKIDEVDKIGNHLILSKKIKAPISFINNSYELNIDMETMDSDDAESRLSTTTDNQKAFIDNLVDETNSVTLPITIIDGEQSNIGQNNNAL